MTLHSVYIMYTLCIHCVNHHVYIVYTLCIHGVHILYTLCWTRYELLRMHMHICLWMSRVCIHICMQHNNKKFCAFFVSCCVSSQSIVHKLSKRFLLILHFLRITTSLHLVFFLSVNCNWFVESCRAFFFLSHQMHFSL